MLFEDIMLTKEQIRDKNGTSYYSQPDPFAMENEIEFSLNKMELPENTMFAVDYVSENRDSSGAMYYYGKVAIKGQVGTEKEKEFRDAGIVFDKDSTLQLCRPVYSKDSDGVISDMTDIKMERC